MDMTKGKPLRLILTFSLPIFAGNLCQLLYSVTDSLVVGRLLGVQAFAAVGAAGSLSWLVGRIHIEFVQGFGILFAQRFGKKDIPGLRRAVAMGLLLSAALACVMTFFSLLLTKPMLLAVSTPEDMLHPAHTYLCWIFAGIPISVAFHLSAALLNALGNSKRPLASTVIASVCNILLDLLFTGVFHWGVAGVAAATIAAQLVSFIYCFWGLRRIPELGLSKEDFHWELPTVKELMRLGFPRALGSTVLNLGGVLVQRRINLYGTLFVAGTTAAMKYLDLMNMAGFALEGAAATFTAQNYGAQNLSRVQEGMRTVRRAALCCALPAGAIAILFRRPLIGFLVSGTAEELEKILTYGGESLLMIALFLPALNLLCLNRAGLQGMGNTVIPMLSGFTELLGRVASLALLSPLLEQGSVYWCYPIGWMGAALLLGVSYGVVYRKRRLEAEAGKT